MLPSALNWIRAWTWGCRLQNSYKLTPGRNSTNFLCFSSLCSAQFLINRKTSQRKSHYFVKAFVLLDLETKLFVLTEEGYKEPYQHGILRFREVLPGHSVVYNWLHCSQRDRVLVSVGVWFGSLWAGAIFERNRSSAPDGQLETFPGEKQ